MKIVELNIGLSSKTIENINPLEVLNALTGRGFTVLAYEVKSSTCRDGEEHCLAVKAECPSDWQAQIADLAKRLGQDCIAVAGFIGHAPYDTFSPSLWVSPVCETSQDVCNEFTLEEFKTYLPQIIADSKESGFEGYAQDLETALHFLRNK